ncbi:hypothetical protein TNIN_305421 [Trichonephila inaurata madagascariensis]|uniref:Uncharacterized protein n=1 Tax=Trichonephila inaurata madagascariensis TaxID=2747483 RepID=A0A8X6YAP0_9ARAC|nr:hypothetical protein TNIN_305421 [Trichonephila inaurata madagascariensis]
MQKCWRSDREKEDNKLDVPTFSSLCDMLETKLKALESLGCSKKKFADFLEPLVESFLPAWEKSRVSKDNDDSTSQRSL